MRLKVGTRSEVLALLRHDVFINGRVAQVVTNRGNFDWLKRQLAGDSKFVGRFLKGNVNLVLVDEIGECLGVCGRRCGDVYVVDNGIQTAIDYFNAAFSRCERSLEKTIKLFDDEYHAGKSFDEMDDAPPFERTEYLDYILENPGMMALVGNAERVYRSKFVEFLFRYLVSLDDEKKKQFFDNLFLEDDPKLDAVKKCAYLKYRSCTGFRSAIKRLPSMKTCGIKFNTFDREHITELAMARMERKMKNGIRHEIW